MKKHLLFCIIILLVLSYQPAKATMRDMFKTYSTNGISLQSSQLQGGLAKADTVKHPKRVKPGKSNKKKTTIISFTEEMPALKILFSGLEKIAQGISSLFK